MALTVDGQVQVPDSGAGTVAHIPVCAPLFASPQSPGPTVGFAARHQHHRAGWGGLAGGIRRRWARRRGLRGQLVDEQARALGGRSRLSPTSSTRRRHRRRDAFADHPRGLAPVQAAFDAARHLPQRLELTPTRFGLGVREAIRGGRRAVGDLRRPHWVADRAGLGPVRAATERAGPRRRARGQ